MKRHINFSDIADDVVKSYLESRSSTKVSKLFHITPSTVLSLCRKAGVVIVKKGKGRRTAKDFSKDSCRYCRAYSRISDCQGWCLTHRRTVNAADVEMCFK